MALCPTSPANFYQLVKIALALLIVGTALAILVWVASIDTSTAESPGFMLERLSDLLLLGFFVSWICILCTACSASNEAWMQPMKKLAIGGAILVILVTLLNYALSLIGFVSLGAEDLSSLAALRIIRPIARLGLVAQNIVSSILFGKARKAALDNEGSNPEFTNPKTSATAATA